MELVPAQFRVNIQNAREGFVCVEIFYLGHRLHSLEQRTLFLQRQMKQSNKLALLCRRRENLQQYFTRAFRVSCLFEVKIVRPCGPPVDAIGSCRGFVADRWEGGVG